MLVAVKELSDGFLKSLVEGLGNLPQTEMPLKHHFSKGLYIRELFIPADTYIVGKIHTTDHLNIMSQGECILYIDNEVHHLVAPCTFEAKAGSMKIAKIIKDVVWSNVHITDETDIEVLENTLTTTSFEERKLLCQ